MNRIFGPDDGRTGTPAADVDWESSADIININYRGLGIGTLSAYAYLLDLEDAPSASSKIIAIAKQLHKNVHLLLKYANYNVDDFGTDTQKAWLQVTVAF